MAARAQRGRGSLAIRLGRVTTTRMAFRLIKKSGSGAMLELASGITCRSWPHPCDARCRRCHARRCHPAARSIREIARRRRQSWRDPRSASCTSHRAPRGKRVRRQRPSRCRHDRCARECRDTRLSSARASMPIAPCATAGRNSSALMMSVACSASPRRLSPASASSVASTSPVVELAQPRLDIAAQWHAHADRAAAHGDRLPAQRRGAEARAMRQLGQGARLAADEHIARIFALKARRQHQPLRQHRRHVFCRMHRKIDAPGQQGLLDLFREQAFAALLRQRPVLDDVAGRPDDDEFNRLLFTPIAPPAAPAPCAPVPGQAGCRAYRCARRLWIAPYNLAMLGEPGSAQRSGLAIISAAVTSPGRARANEGLDDRPRHRDDLR